MKPIIIREENKQIIMSIEEFKKTIQEVYEEGITIGKLEERALKNTTQLIYRNPSDASQNVIPCVVTDTISCNI